MAAGKPPNDPQPVLEITPWISPLPSAITIYHDGHPENTDQHILWYNINTDKTGGLDPAAWQTVGPESTGLITATATKDGTAVTSTAAFHSLPGEPERIEYWTVDGGVEGKRQTVNATSVSSKPVSSSIVTTGSTTVTGSTETSTGEPEKRTTDTLKSASPLSTSSAAGTATTIPSEPHHNGLKGGAVAGVAVGCLIAGALIAGVLAWFCLRRRKPAVAGRDSEASTVALMDREKGPAAKTRSLSSGSPIAPALEHGLPQPLEDKAIAGEISKISNLIKNHVQSYYHSRAVSPGTIDYDGLQALGERLPVSVGTLSTLLNNSATREIALRFCLAWVVTSRIQSNDSSNTTFLPPEVAKSIQSMNHVEQQSRVHSLLYSKWRALTAELLQSSYTRNPFSADDGRVHNIQAAATLLDSVLRPYADSRMDDGARSRNLEEILKRAAQFAFTLFSQPTAWDFNWQNEHGDQSGSLCIFPALVQTSDENGEPLNPPRPFTEAVNRRLDE